MNLNVQKLIIQFLKFGIVGISNVIISLSIYYILIFTGIHYLVANTIGYTAGILNSYYWNNRFVFQNSIRSRAKKLAKVFASYLITYFINTGLLSFFIQVIEISKLLAPILVIIITLPINFLLNKYWAFKE